MALYAGRCTQPLILIIERTSLMNQIQAVTKQHFFNHVEDFMSYRKTVYDISDQTRKSNLIDINLFKDFLDMKDYQVIDGKTVMDFQYYLRQQRLNNGASMNRKLFTLRSYAKYLKLEQIPFVEALPFQDVLKCRQGYRTRPEALTKNQVKSIFQSIDQDTCLGVRDYAVYVFLNERI